MKILGDNENTSETLIDYNRCSDGCNINGKVMHAESKF